MDGKERLCLAQISNTLLKDYSYNEIHNRRVALGITCVQCTPVQVGIILSLNLFCKYVLSNLMPWPRLEVIHSTLLACVFRRKLCNGEISKFVFNLSMVF